MFFGIAIVATAHSPQPALAADVRPEQVRQSIRSAVVWLRRQIEQNAIRVPVDERFRTGAEALILLALLEAGESHQERALDAVLTRIADSADDYTYNMALKIAVLVRADPVRHRRAIERAARKLINGQLGNGSWTYGGGDVMAALTRGDNSNTQFALLGLGEAARAGVRIRRDVWRNAQRYWESCQTSDGGWAYVSSSDRSYGSMTAAGVASLVICGATTARSLERPYRNGSAELCGRYATPRSLAAGLAWLAKHFDVTRNPQHSSYHFYWLYAVERAGILTGLKYFGTHDWYREGATYLVAAQEADGSWNNSFVDTSFALLFLAKGRRPVLINKLQWSEDSRWNLDRNDAANLVAFVGDSLGEPTAWQAVPLDADLLQWREAPILYVNGHDFPAFTRRQRAQLRQYVEAGGTLLFEACCSRQAFTDGFSRFARDVFPESPPVELDGEHPVWSALHKLAPGRFRLLGIDVACRTSVFFAPVDLSCLWEQADHAQSQEAFQLGANIAAYATGREPLRDRLDVADLPEKPSEPKPGGPPVTAGLRIAHLTHSADWRTDAGAMPKLAEFLRCSAGVDVVTQPIVLAPDDPALLSHPIAYMTGHYSFELKPAELDGLRAYLRRGGFLFADACCGRAAFDRSFRSMCARLFPESELALHRLPPDHPIVRGSPGFDLRRVGYRPAVRQKQPQLNELVLEAVTIDGRAVIVYSPYGFTCGLEDHACYQCRGLAPQDARKLGANLVLYALSY